MRALNKFMLFPLLLAGLVSCDDPRGNNLTENKIYIPSSGVINASLYEISEIAMYKTGVTKSGFFDVSATAQIAVATQEQLDEFNKTNNTNFVLLPESCYTLDNTNLTFESTDRQAIIDISFNLPLLKALDQTVVTYALPVYITSASLEINNDYRLSVIVPKIEQPFVKLGITGSASKSFDYKGFLKLQLPIEIAFENTWDIKCIFESTQAAFDEFNNANGNSFQIVPAEAYTIDSPVIMKGTKNAIVNISVDKSKLGYTSYALPIKLASSEAAGIAGGFPIFLGEKGDQNLFTATFNTSNNLKRDAWKLIDVTSESASEGTNGPASKMLDNDLTSFWHQAWESSAQPPHEFTVDMGEGSEVTTISAVRLAGRASSTRVLELIDVYTSLDNVTWTKVSPDVPYKLKGSGHTETFILAKPSEARYVKVSIGDVNAHLAEVWLFGYDPREDK